MTPSIRLWGLPALAVLALAAGAVVAHAGHPHAAAELWLTLLIVTGSPLVWTTVRGVGRGRFAADLVATFAIIMAMVLAQPAVGLVIVLMQSGGSALERFAMGRAADAVRALEAAAPRTAHLVSDAGIVDVAADAVIVGNELLVRPGELVPCDGVIIEGLSDIDTAVLTGEPLPVAGRPGIVVHSGTTNGAGALRIRATAAASRSQYALIVDLVRTAQASKAPVQRMADRYAIVFTPVTIAVCLGAFALTRDWERVFAVLVVATPCPLILAAPIGIIGGINRAARRGIIVRNGAALEQLSRVDTAVFDKTGTMTRRRPVVRGMQVVPPHTRAELLGAAASVEQESGHVLGRVTVDAAQRERIALFPVTQLHEEPGAGVTGVVNGRMVHVGGRSYVLARSHPSLDAIATLEAGPTRMLAYVAIDDTLVGTIEYAEEVRPELLATVARLRRLGVRQMLVLSGDRTDVVQAVARQNGFTDARGDLLPADKASVVAGLRAPGRMVMMVGDGTNDAPALATADIGVALASAGGGIATEAADVVILVDAVDRVADAVEIGRRSLRITRQSIWVGLGLSACAMVFAAYGMIPPVAGAILQECIDVAVIINALRSSLPAGR